MKKIHITLLFLTLLTVATWSWTQLQLPADGQAYAIADNTPANFAPKLQTTLQTSWDFYKSRFMVDNARVASNNYAGTISEGQSYALLKAVWMDDPDTFRKTWQWTKRNMQRSTDHLIGWRWGEGSLGQKSGLVETENATDADQDIAYALLLAGEKWNQPAYTLDAKAMIQDLWRLNVQELDGHYYLKSGTWEGFNQQYLTLNPSYFAPYVYRKFANYDTVHATGWQTLANDIYDTLEACTNLTEPKLPPNWCAVTWDKPAGYRADKPIASRIVFSDIQGEGARDFSYDAFRVYWRMAMDAKLSPKPGSDRAKAYLRNHPFLLSYWHRHGFIPEGFTADGTPRSEETSGFSSGPVLTLNHVMRPELNCSLYQQVLGKHYHPDGYWFNDYNDFMHSVIWLHLYALSL